jgi:ribA/ribD-fused uncharacterized protein
VRAEALVGEVADEIARLRDEPTSETRCIDALDAYLHDPSADNQALLREAYLSVPEHNRAFLLGDQDARDMPIRVLAVPTGQPPLGFTAAEWPDLVTDEWRAEMFAYFSNRDAAREAWVAKTNRDDPDGPRQEGTAASTVGRFGGQFDRAAPGWMRLEGDAYLSNDAPIAVVIDGVEYPSATHAYWALSTDDDQARRDIRDAPNPSQARSRGAAARRRPGWAERRLAEMTRVVREKFTQHPELATRLIATGTARLVDGASMGGPYWGAGPNGRNWHGRILELVRSEMAAR